MLPARCAWIPRLVRKDMSVVKPLRRQTHTIRTSEIDFVDAASSMTHTSKRERCFNAWDLAQQKKVDVVRIGGILNVSWA